MNAGPWNIVSLRLHWSVSGMLTLCLAVPRQDQPTPRGILMGAERKDEKAWESSGGNTPDPAVGNVHVDEPRMCDAFLTNRCED